MIDLNNTTMILAEGGDQIRRPILRILVSVTTLVEIGKRNQGDKDITGKFLKQVLNLRPLFGC